ncbi:MAG TPA: lysophospholipid acyltransferase family protein [Gemmataceae bacterium]|nr:lysophospholipid acyltransferase family protein [Gemmataceae bacterium]
MEDRASRHNRRRLGESGDPRTSIRDPRSPPREGWLASLWYDSVFLASMTGFTLGFSLRTEGMEHVPVAGPALLIANHQSYLDPPLVGLAARRHLRFLARKTLFGHAVFARLIRSLNAVPIDQEGLGLEGLRVILHHLKAGEAVLVFPEGERTHDGQLQPLRPGVQLLIKRARAPVVPVGIAGAFEAWPRWRNYPLPAPLLLATGKRALAVSIGPPLDADRLLGLPRDRLLGALSADLHRVMTRAERLRRKA